MGEESDGDRLLLWILVGVMLAALGASLTLGVLFWPESPCQDATAISPQIAFGMSYNQTTNTLTLIHERGDRLTDENTNSLTVRIYPDGAKEYATRHVLASDATGGYPVQSGDRWRFTNVSVKGRSLSEGDQIRVHWTGPDTIPSYCPNWKEETATLAQYVLQSGDK